MAAINLPIVSKFSDKGVKQAQGAFDGIGSTLGKLAGIVAAAFSVKAIVDFGKESILAAEQVATANARIQNIAESMTIFGDETDAVSQRLINLAESQELLLATDSNIIKGTQAKLLTFKELAASAGDVGGAFDRATAAAIDLAAAGFGDAEMNAVQLGKALNDPIKGITALTRSGITFTEEEQAKIKALTESGKALEAQDMILKAIEMQVGGTAAATANASDRMKLAFGDIKETAGAALLPAFATLSEAVLPLIEKFLPILETFITEKIAPALERGAEAFKTFATGISEGTFSFADLAEKLQGFLKDGLQFVVDFLTGDGLKQMLTAFMEMRTVIINAFIELIPIVVNALVELLPQVVQTIASMLPDILKTAVETFNALVEAVVIVLPILLKELLGMLPALIKTIISLLPDIIDSAIILFTGLITALVDVIPELLDAIIESIPEITDAIIDALPQIMDAAFKLFTGLVTALYRAWPDLIGGLMELVPKIFDTIIGFIPKLIGLGGELVGGLVRGMMDAIPKLIGEAIDSIGKTLTNGVKAIFQIKSPSRVFMGIGEDLVAGLGEGITDNLRTLENASLGMTSTVTGTVEGGLSAMGDPIGLTSPSGASGNTMQLNVTVNAGMGADGSDIGRKIVDEILRFERSSGRVFARA